MPKPLARASAYPAATHLAPGPTPGPTPGTAPSTTPRRKPRRAATRLGLAGALSILLASFTTIAPGVHAPSAAAAGDWMPEQLPAWSVITKRDTTEPVDLTNGLEFSRETIDSIDGRVPIQVLRADTNNVNIDVRTVSSNDRVVDPQDEVLTSMASRTGAVAGVNGGYFWMGNSGDVKLGEIVDGEIYKSPAHNQEGTFSVLDDGSMVIGKQEFSGTITAGEATHALDSINWIQNANGDKITLITPRLGAVESTYLKGEHQVALGTSSDGGKTITITEVKSATALDVLPEGTYGLLTGDAASAGGQWLTASVQVGDTVNIGWEIAPNNNIDYMVQGPGRILKDGELFDDPHHQMPTDGVHPETAVGITAAGELLLATFDGSGTASTRLGVIPPQAGAYLRSLGATDAVLLDGGGSTEMVARMPGDQDVSVVNTPSDNGERPVGNGIFVYSAAAQSGPAAQVRINNNQPLTAALGAETPVPAYAVDVNGNPARSSDPMQVTVEPAALGTWADGVFTGKQVGEGTLTVTANGQTSTVDVQVIDKFESLTISPKTARVFNGSSKEFSVSGTISGGASAPIDPSSVQWSVDQADLGSITPEGVFTAADTGAGVVKVTATIGNQSVSASVDAGSIRETMLVTDEVGKLKATARGGTTMDPENAFRLSTDVPEGATQEHSLAFDFAFPDSPAQHSVEITPGEGYAFDVPEKNGVTPEYARVTMKVDNPAETKEPAWLVANLVDSAGRVQALWLQMSPSQYGHWITKSMKIRWGKLTEYPLHFSNFRWVGQNAKAAAQGTFSISQIQLSYPPSQAPEETYEPIATGMPEWLTYENSAAAFKPGGTTYILGDDAHLVAAAPESSSAVNVANMAKRTKGEAYTSQAGQTVAPVAEAGRPDLVVSLGDISDTGDVVNLEFAKAQWEKFGLPLWDVIGNHEVSQGDVPANGNFYDVFQQDTHFSFVQGNSTFIGLDSSRGGIKPSQNQQVPDEEQYAWLTEQLEQITTDTVFIGTHWPAYDPLPNKTNQFGNRWEAQQYLQIINNYRAGHPEKRVVLFYGHSRGFATQFIDPAGRPGTSETGIPQFTIADVGTPPYTAADKGGFYHFALFHVNEDGSVQYTVEPLLQSIEINEGTKEGVKDGRATNTDPVALKVDETRIYTALATNTAGKGDNAAPSMPVQAPLSHVWASSNEDVATVDPVTGEVTAVGGGAAQISVTSGGITAVVNISVEPTSAVPTTAPSVSPLPTIDPSDVPVEPTTSVPGTAPTLPPLPSIHPTTVPVEPTTSVPGTAPTLPPLPSIDPTTVPTTDDPGASEPGASEPGASDPGASEPGASEPDASEPGAPWMPGEVPSQTVPQGDADSNAPLAGTGANLVPTLAIGALILAAGGGILLYRRGHTS